MRPQMLALEYAIFAYIAVIGAVAAVVISTQNSPISTYEIEVVEAIIVYAEENPNSETARTLVEVYQDEQITRMEYQTLSHIHQNEIAEATTDTLVEKVSGIAGQNSSDEQAIDD